MNTKPGEVVAVMAYREDDSGQVLSTIEAKWYGFQRASGDSALKQMVSEFVASVPSDWTIKKSG